MEIGTPLDLNLGLIKQRRGKVRRLTSSAVTAGDIHQHATCNRKHSQLVGDGVFPVPMETYPKHRARVRQMQREQCSSTEAEHAIKQVQQWKCTNQPRHRSSKRLKGTVQESGGQSHEGRQRHRTDMPNSDSQCPSSARATIGQCVRRHATAVKLSYTQTRGASLTLSALDHSRLEP